VYESYQPLKGDGRVMKTNVTIVMYHYVREIENSLFPNLRGLEFESFIRQLNFLQNKYNIISAETFLNGLLNRIELPENPCLLTFDDGYRDHIKYVAPELNKRRLQGFFFPPAKAILDRDLLDVHGIQFILASCKNFSALTSELDRYCLEGGISREELNFNRNTFNRIQRYDPAEVVYFKRMLQHILPAQLRHYIVCDLFQKYVTKDQQGFADQLYLLEDDVRQLVESGHYVGAHGYRHQWLDQLNEKNQTIEIEQSLQFLERVSAPTKDWIMCYPYGSYNRTTLKILKKFYCVAGFTTKVGRADSIHETPLELPRLDTNDFPQ
jgi:peptidoglycan/xylan/chitin deacetylase (PgdA/CDA1 family)